MASQWSLKFRQLRSQSPWDSLSSAKPSRERRGCVETPRPSLCERRFTGRISEGVLRGSGPLSHGKGGSLGGQRGQRGAEKPGILRSPPRRPRPPAAGTGGTVTCPRIMAKLSGAPVCMLAGGVRGESPAPAPDRFADPLPPPPNTLAGVGGNGAHPRFVPQRVRK